VSYFIDCEDFFFRALDSEDLDGTWPEWLNDPVITRYQNKGYFPCSRDTQKEYLEQIRANSSDVVFALVEKQSGTHFGNAGLHNIDWLHRTAALGIVIGLRDFHGRGWGKTAWENITNYGFRTLGLDKLTAMVWDGNAASSRCAEACGYVVEGRQREQYFKNGVRIDAILMGLTRGDWERRNMEREGD